MLFSIIIILAYTLVPTLTKYVADTKLRKAQRDGELICSAIGRFHNDTGLMPVSSNYGGGTKDDVETLRGPGNNPRENPNLSVANKWLNKTMDDLDDQIIGNGANYPTTGNKRWKGPYLRKLSMDPWGNSYLVNVKWVQPVNMTGANGRKSCFVLSAGPNGEIDTEFERDTATPGGDDIVCRIK